MSENAILIVRIIVAVILVMGTFGNSFTRQGEEGFRKWGFPPYFRHLISGLELVAAVMLFIPALALVGLVLAGVIMVGAIATLFRHREYAHSIFPIVTLALIIVLATR